MKHVLTALMLASAALLCATAQAQTASAPAASSAAPAKKTVKKTAKKAAPAKAEEDEPEPDVAGTTVFDYQCELGAKITVFQNNDNDQHVAVKWGKRIHQLDRVDTTTGANRFENKHYGLIWIAIPSKGMLLDSKTGHQLANECRTSDQRAALEAAKTASAAAPAAGPK